MRPKQSLFEFTTVESSSTIKINFSPLLLIEIIVAPIFVGVLLGVRSLFCYAVLGTLHSSYKTIWLRKRAGCFIAAMCLLVFCVSSSNRGLGCQGRTYTCTQKRTIISLAI